jgi:glycosyltransferase involved in cell wall biosynthesis
MRLFYLADGHSPIALGWIAYFVDAGHEVHLLSTFASDPALKLASFSVISVALSGVAGRDRRSSNRIAGSAGSIPLRTALRHWLGPFTIPRAACVAREMIKAVRPDLVHAMRIPFEGMLAAEAIPSAPLVLSVWGNDLTLHAPSAPGMALFTRRTLARTDALHADCYRDIRLARQWGFPGDRPIVVLPGNGGVRTEVFHPGEPDQSVMAGPIGAVLAGIPVEAPVVVNPRGFRAYVRNDTFFQSIPEIIRVHPQTVFVCPAMAGEAQAMRWVERLGIDTSVRLLPRLSAAEMAAVFQRAQVSISVTEHDGTPNTLLEAMACGCFPVAGDLESIREWIGTGVNGLLIDPAEPSDLAKAVVRALADADLRAYAADHNRSLISERATREKVMAEAEIFYRTIVD